MPTIDSLTSLHSAVLENNEKAVRFLLKHGANPNARATKPINSNNSTYQNNIGTRDVNDIFSKYRRSSFSINWSLEQNPMYLSAESPCSSFRRWSSQSVIITSNQYKTLTPMHIAAANGNVYIMQMLVNYGGDVNIELEGDYTPIMIAVLYRHYNLVELLAKKGANLNAQARGGKTAMYIATKIKQVNMVEFLLGRGADPNLSTDQGATPLHIAVDRKLPEVAEMLLMNGAKANVSTKTGVTPLHCAAVNGETGIAEMILKYGGDASAIVKEGVIDVAPLLWVTETESRKIMEVVQKYTPKRKSSNSSSGFYGTFFRKIWRQLGLKKL